MTLGEGDARDGTLTPTVLIAVKTDLALHCEERDGSNVKMIPVQGASDEFVT